MSNWWAAEDPPTTHAPDGPSTPNVQPAAQPRVPTRPASRSIPTATAAAATPQPQPQVPPPQTNALPQPQAPVKQSPKAPQPNTPGSASQRVPTSSSAPAVGASPRPPASSLGPVPFRSLAGVPFLNAHNATLEEDHTSDDLHDRLEPYLMGAACPTNVAAPRAELMPYYPVDHVPAKDLSEHFIGRMTHGVTVRPLRFEPSLFNCGHEPMTFELAATTFGPKIGEGVVSYPICGFIRRTGDVTVTLPDATLRGALTFHPVWAQQRITIAWEGADSPINSVRGEPCLPPCFYKERQRIGHVASVVNEENEHFVRYWDGAPRYSTCRSWVANSVWFMPVILLFQGALKVANYFGFGCDFVTTMQEQCGDIECGELFEHVKQCECAQICARKKLSSYRPLTGPEAREAVNARYALQLSSIRGDEHRDLNAVGHVRLSEDGRFDKGCLYKRYHLDPTDVGVHPECNNLGDVTSFDMYFRGATDANTLQTADLQLVMGYLTIQNVLFQIGGGNAQALKSVLPAVDNYTAYTSFRENPEAPQRQTMV